MTDQKRHQEFMAGYRELMQLTGYQITPAINSKQYGNAVMVEPIAQVLPIPDWQPPPLETKSETEDEVEAKAED